MRDHPIALGVAFSIALTAVIALTAGRLESFAIVGPGAPFEYPWRLVEVSQPARLSAWLGYALHNLAAWGVIAAARRERPKYSGDLRWFNVWMMGIHAVFGVLHVVQTQLWYDGLARDVPEVTALGSVALMLMVILILENPRRGLVLGWKAPFGQRMMQVIKDTHGYLFTWALIYTFWYHPTEGTPGHLVGFLYILLLLWQSTLLFHRAHLNRRWTLALELLVIPHGVIVALLQGQGLWPMFLFGFGAVFMLTQLYGLGWGKPLRRLAWVTFVVGTVAIYAWFDRLPQLHEVTRIPVLDYGVVLLLWGGFALLARLKPPAANA